MKGRALVDEIGDDLSLPAIVLRMVQQERSWVAFTFFCRTIMRQKENDERERERCGERRHVRSPATEDGVVAAGLTGPSGGARGSRLTATRRATPAGTHSRKG